ncbi:MAG TPA: hypothetical protein ENJ82_17105, partial [Bacteroidetes bacterium]|nr:hypothetical protein [Bacteroidota bacterium]
MIDLLAYLWEASIYLAGFYLLYRFVLGRLSHFSWNRFFLLFGLLSVVLLPFAEIPVAVNSAALRKNVFQGLTGISAENEQLSVRKTTPKTNFKEDLGVVPAKEVMQSRQENSWSWPGFLVLVWGFGAGYMLLELLIRLFRLWLVFRQNPQKSLNGIKVTCMPAGQGTFSFFKRIYLDDDGLTSPEKQMVLAHEQAHGELWHSLDNLFMELVAAIFWFNPLVYPWRNALQTVHEYQADAAVVAKRDPIVYSRLLLHLSQPQKQNFPVHAFSQSETGRRIEMLHHLPSQPMSKLKYLILLPLVSVFLYAFALVPGEYNFKGDPNSTQEFVYEFAKEPIPIGQAHVGEKLAVEMEWLQAHPKRCVVALKRAQMWRSTLLGILKEEGIPSDFFYLALAESMLKSGVKSSMGAAGMWQFMPETARNCGLEVSGNRDQRLNPIRATHAAARFLRELYAEVGTWTATASAYNLGVNGYQKHLAKHQANSYFAVSGSQENYLYRIIAFKRLIEFPAAFGQSAPVKTASHPPHGAPLAGKIDISARFGPRVHPFSGEEKL